MPQTQVSIENLPDYLYRVRGCRIELPKGRFFVGQEIHVGRESELIIGPQTKLIFPENVGITVDGSLVVRGRPPLSQGGEPSYAELTSDWRSNEDEDSLRGRTGWSGIHIKPGAQATLDFAKISHGRGRQEKSGFHEDTQGGAILIESDTSSYDRSRKNPYSTNPQVNLRVSNSVFERNCAKWGGVIYNGGGLVEVLENNRFTENLALFGGVIHNTRSDPDHLYYVFGKVIVLSGNVFDHNLARQAGGAIWNGSSRLEIVHANSFLGNQANSGGSDPFPYDIAVGGAICDTHGGTVIGSDNRFIGNLSQGNGGAISTGTCLRLGEGNVFLKNAASPYWVETCKGVHGGGGAIHGGAIYFNGFGNYFLGNFAPIGSAIASARVTFIGGGTCFEANIAQDSEHALAGCNIQDLCGGSDSRERFKNNKQRKK